MKIKNFCSGNDTLNRIRRQALDWEGIFAKYLSDKEYIFKIYKKSQDSRIKIFQPKMSKIFKQIFAQIKYTDEK